MVIDAETLTWLRSPAGSALLADLAERELHDDDLLRELTRLRRTYPPELARAALEQTLLRRRAAGRLPQAEQLFYTRDALEQLSAQPVADWRAQRIAGLAADAADLGCGIGGDSLALARAGIFVTAVDRDPLRLLLTAVNAEVLGLSDRVQTRAADLERDPPPPAAALFCDPARRTEQRRLQDPAAYSPSLTRVLSWRQLTPLLAVKLAPGIDAALLPTDAELEFVSLDGEMKEAVLWIGPAAAGRTATLLRRSRSTPESPAVIRFSADQVLPPQLSSSRRFLIEPDPAIIRAGLVSNLAAQLDAAQLDPQIAYLTADHDRVSPYARAWPILQQLPFNLKQLQRTLRDYDVGAVTVKKRGSPLETDQLARRLSGNGTQPLVVVLTRVANQPTALICGEISRTW
jgi:hypothetical protein